MTILLGLRFITSRCARCRALATRRIVGAILDAGRAEAARGEDPMNLSFVGFAQIK